MIKAEKLCHGCNLILPLENFNTSKRDKYSPRCKPCTNEAARKRHIERRVDPAYMARKAENARKNRLNNPRSYERRKREWLRSLYKLTLERYNEMMAAQNYACAVCQKECKSERGLAVDHDHSCCPKNKSCGKCIRGLLCINCNRGLGMFQDDPVLLNRAIDYLSSPK